MRRHRPEEIQREWAGVDGWTHGAKVLRRDAHTDLLEQFTRRCLSRGLAWFDLASGPLPVVAKCRGGKSPGDQPLWAPTRTVPGDRNGGNGGGHESRLSDKAGGGGLMCKTTWKINEIGCASPIDGASPS